MVLNSIKNDHRTVKIQCMLSNQQFHQLNTHNILPEYEITKYESIKFNKFIHTKFEVLNNDSKDKSGIFFSLQYEDELYVFSGSNAAFFNKVVLSICRQLYPKVLFAFIHSNGIYKILNDFESVLNTKLKYTGALKKQIFGLSPRTEREWEIAREGRLYSSFSEAFEEARKDDLWIENIKVFSGTDLKRPKIHFSVSRKGLVSFDKGTFDSLFSNILHPIIEYSKERKKQFEHRSRNEQFDKKSKPLIVKFGKNVFEKTETRQEFSKILKKYPYCNYSIIHSGNPHVYLSILDRHDNSSFSVRTYGADSLLLIPQIKTSALSLMRFSEFLVSAFYEGVIQNFEQKEKFTVNKTM